MRKRIVIARNGEKRVPALEIANKNVVELVKGYLARGTVEYKFKYESVK